MTSKLRTAARRILEPAMAELGFEPSFPHFRRRRQGQLDLVSLQHDKWGGGFFLEFAKHPTGDLQTSWGERVPEKKIEVAYTDPLTRARLLATTEHSDERLNYFRYDTIAKDRDAFDKLFERLVRALPQMIAWLEDGTIGANVSPFNSDCDSAPKTHQAEWMPV